MWAGAKYLANKAWDNRAAIGVAAETLAPLLLG